MAETEHEYILRMASEFKNLPDRLKKLAELSEQFNNPAKVNMIDEVLLAVDQEMKNIQITIDQLKEAMK